jgi:ubiquinone/menaquinone biosynthesis C-methylase UbiE
MCYRLRTGILGMGRHKLWLVLTWELMGEMSEPSKGLDSAGGYGAAPGAAARLGQQESSTKSPPPPQAERRVIQEPGKRFPEASG